jgi:hypothetical protein
MSVVNLRDPDLERMVIGPFKGLNAYDAPYTLARYELVSAVNVNLRERSVVSRLGQASRIDILHTLLYKAIRGMWRYVRRDGTKKLFVYSGDTVYADNDDTDFDPVVSMATDDGYVRFTQHRDAVMMFSRSDDMRFYDTNLFSAQDIHPLPYLQLIPSTTTSDTGGQLPAASYFYYRFTVDAYADDTFIGELPLGFIRDDSAAYYTSAADMTGYAGADDNMVTLKRFIGFQLPSWVKNVNVYRSAPLSAASAAYDVEAAAYYWVGSFTATTYNAAAVGGTLFEDKWDVPYGKAFRYGLSVFAPRARHAVMHKGRVWLGNVSVLEGESETNPHFSTGTWTDYPSLIYWSYFGENGIEPTVFTVDGNQEIEAQDGDGITGLLSVRGAGLLVFKPGSTSIVRGAGHTEHPGRSLGRQYWLYRSGVDPAYRRCGDLAIPSGDCGI